jgi:hypothetical protein
MIHASGACKRQLYAFFLDIRKAYDTVWRDGLFYKLKAKGIKGKSWRTLYDLFGKSTSTVRVAGTVSEPFELLVGVGQGDPLSTLLFDIYIDDLLETLHTECGGNGVAMSELVNIVALAFADDVTCVSHQPHKLQASIDHVAAWLRKWRMDANTIKSKVVVFNPPAGQAAGESPLHAWSLGGALIAQVASIKYLGVWFNESGSWDLHYDKALAKMKRALGYWRPLLSCHRLAIQIRLLLLQTFVYSAALYGSEVWSATREKLGAFDVVVKKAVRSIMGLRRSEVGSDALLLDAGLTAPSRLVMVNKLCYQKHLNGLDAGRWCRQALACAFGGARSVGRPRAGANWVGEVHRSAKDVCFALNIKDLFVAAGDQRSARRVSARAQVPGVVQVEPHAQDAIGAESSSRKTLLDNIWLWHLDCLKKKCERMAACSPAWYFGCVSRQPRCVALYLRVCSSKQARLIMSARSGRLTHLQSRLQESVAGEVGPSDNACRCCHCQESMENRTQAALHCMVDCPVMWPRLDTFFEFVQGLHDRSGKFADKLLALSGDGLITAILAPSLEEVPRNVAGEYWAAVAVLYSGLDDTLCERSHGVVDGLGSVNMSLLALSDSVYVSSSDSQVALGVVNVLVDTAVL